MPSTAADSPDRTLVRLVLVVLVVLVLAPLLAMGFAMPIMGGMGWRWYDDGTVGGAPWWGLGTGLGWLAVLGSIAYVVYRRLVTAGTEQRPDAALAELRLASARGDLTDDEFEARRAVLERDAQA